MAPRTNEQIQPDSSSNIIHIKLEGTDTGIKEATTITKQNRTSQVKQEEQSITYSPKRQYDMCDLKCEHVTCSGISDMFEVTCEDHTRSAIYNGRISPSPVPSNDLHLNLEVEDHSVQTHKTRNIHGTPLNT